MKDQSVDCKTFRKKLPYTNPRNFIGTLMKCLRIYCDRTSLHGLRYITTGRTIADSAIWFVISLLALIFCLILMLRVWMNFANNPTVTIIDTSSAITNLDFPGVTICNNNKVYKPHADVLRKALSLKGFDDTMSNKLFSSLMKLIRPDKIEIDNATASWAIDILGYTVEKLMFELMQPCSSLLRRCRWLGKIFDCNKIFKVVRANEGYCCGFNYHYNLSKKIRYGESWTMNLTTATMNDRRFNASEELPGVGQILHAPGAGRDIGLSVALNVDGPNYESSVRPYIGATIMVHDPIDYPEIGATSATVQPGQVLAIALTGTSIISSEDILNVPLHKRECLFDGEVFVNETYSYQTCISKCMMRQVYGFCGCLPFFFPDARVLAVIPLSYLKECKCVPQCNDRSYDMNAESIQMNIRFDSTLTRGLDQQNTSFLYVFFREGTYPEYRKQSIIGWDGLFASFGGIFGLCLGGSVISLVEIIYLLVTELFDLRKKEQEQLRKILPPASELFVSIPVKEFCSDKKNVSVQKNVFPEYDKSFHRRGRNRFCDKDDNVFNLA